MNTLKEKQSKVVDLVCQFYNVPKDKVLGRFRESKYLQPRQVIMHLFRTKLLLPLAQIGEYFGRDHTTVIHALRVVENCINCGDYIANDLERLTRFMKEAEFLQENKILVNVPKDIDLMRFVSDLTKNYNVSYTVV